MHGEFSRLLFLQAHQETEAHFTAAGMPSQRNHADMFRFCRAAFYQSLKSKVGLAAKAAALRLVRDGHTSSSSVHTSLHSSYLIAHVLRCPPLPTQTSPGVLGSIPTREEPGKTGAPCVKSTGFLTGPSTLLHALPFFTSLGSSYSERNRV